METTLSAKHKYLGAHIQPANTVYYSDMCNIQRHTIQIPFKVPYFINYELY